MRVRQPLFILAAAALVAMPAAAQHFPSNDSLTAILRTRVGATGVGMVLGVIDANGKTQIVSYGSPGLDAKPLGPRSVFEMGSITKVFTGILLADLVESKKVALNDPVQKYLPAGVKMPTRNGKVITLLDLATHRSSLTRMPTNLRGNANDAYPKYSIPEMYAFLNAHQLRRDIGSEYEYSNIAVALLGHVIERVNGKPYEQLVQERILRPLGMTNSSTRIEPVKAWLTVGHDERGLTAQYRGWEELPGMGALRSNAEDMLKFIAANVGPADTRLKRVMRMAHEPHNVVHPGADIGLNFEISKFGETRIIQHGGATEGFRTFAAFDPATRVGAVVLANYPASHRDIVLHLIKPTLPLNGALIARAEVDVPESVLRSYVGDYELRPGFSLNITFEDGALHSQATGQPKTQLFAESQSNFFLKQVNALFAFQKDRSGKVTGLAFTQGGREQQAPRRVAVGVPLTLTEAALAALPGRKTTIASRHLGGDRALRIVMPAGYEMTQSMRYPVLYVLETERPLQSATAVTSALASGRRAPDMIVVHVAKAPAAAERAVFAKFLTEELQPWVAKEYRAEQFAVLVGDEATLAATTFPAEIVVSPDLSARASFKGQSQPAAPATDPHAALGESLKWLFDGWQLANLTALATQPDSGWRQIDAHYARLSERYGFKALPPEVIYDQAAIALANQRKFDDAVRAFEKNVVLHPGSGVSWNHLGDAYRMVCRWPESKERYAKAYELAQAMSYANVSNYSMELTRVAEEIQAAKPCTPAGATRTAVPVAESILRTYVGEYALSARISITVTFDGGRLHAQPSGEPVRAMGALSETRFFIEGSSVELSFTKDASGAVSGIVAHQGGRETPGRKVK